MAQYERDNSNRLNVEKDRIYWKGVENPMASSYSSYRPATWQSAWLGQKSHQPSVPSQSGSGFYSIIVGAVKFILALAVLVLGLLTIFGIFGTTAIL